MMTCKICAHGDRAAIDRALIDGVSLRDVAGQFGVSRSALDRHRRHIPKALSETKKAETVAESTSLLSRVEKLIGRCENICEKATNAGRWAGAAMAAREIRGCLELLGKISGQLQAKNTAVAINFGDITNVDMRSLTDDQLNALYERIVWTRSDEWIDGKIAGLLGATTIAEGLLFDEVTVARPANYETCMRSLRNLRELDIANGKAPRGWNPCRNASADDRLRLLFSAWLNLTGEDIAGRFSGPELSQSPMIQIDFDLTAGRDQWWDSWPKARLLVSAVQDGRLLAPASPAQGGEVPAR